MRNRTFQQHQHEDDLMADLMIIMNGHRHEINDEVTRSRVIDELNGALNQDVEVKTHHVICDQSNNTPQRVDARELWADVAVTMTWGEDALIHMALRITP